jgi:hypothetical protein
VQEEESASTSRRKFIASVISTAPVLTKSPKIVPASGLSDSSSRGSPRDLKQRGVNVRVGMEATGYSRWFERLLAELRFELWIGNAAEITRKLKIPRHKLTQE